MININIKYMCIIRSILANCANYRGLLVKCDGLGALFFALTVSYHRLDGLMVASELPSGIVNIYAGYRYITGP